MIRQVISAATCSVALLSSCPAGADVAPLPKDPPPSNQPNNANKPKKSGCSLAMPGQPAAGASLAPLALGALWLVVRRRRRTSVP
jgi:MYXO-CTERM domain-containing protein